MAQEYRSMEGISWPKPSDAWATISPTAMEITRFIGLAESVLYFSSPSPTVQQRL